MMKSRGRPLRMTSHKSILLLVVLSLLLISITKSLYIEPNMSTIGLQEENKEGDIVFNFTVGPAKPGSVLYVKIDDSKNCLNLGKAKDMEITCTQTCTVPLVSNNVLDREGDRKCFAFKITVTCGFQKPLLTNRRYNVYLNDINDQAPIFTDLRYKTIIPENFTVGDLLPGLNIKAKDADNGLNASVVYSLTPAGQNPAGINGVMVINSKTGEIRLNQPLDYETRNFYQYRVMAKDKGVPPLNSTASVWIQITDVQDTRPVFIKPSFIAHIEEETPINSLVMTVSAVDGDRGKPNEIFYEAKDGCNRFSINRTTGQIYVTKVPNLVDEDLKRVYGVCSITVTAKEVNNPSSFKDQNVTIFIDDIDNQKPTFNEKEYKMSVSEASERGNPVTTDKAVEITDNDIKVENSKFHIHLSKLDGSEFTALTVSPNESISQAVVSLLVADKTQLDYEKTKSLQFKIIAQGENKWNSSAKVDLTILPFNEFGPTFKKNYTASLFENVTQSHSILQVEATDEDSGTDGEITYRLYGSDDVFVIDPQSGNVSLGTKGLDYEKIQSYHLTVEATDGGNKRATTNLDIFIKDVNDEKPEFTSSKYEETVKENENFTITVEAKDNDEPNTTNSEVHYRILKVSQNLTTNFTIDESTGVIQGGPIDYERLTNSQIDVEVEAFDLGNPSQSSRTQVTINVQDMNDNTPKFSESIYNFEVPENATTDYKIGVISATDGDRSSINKKLTYVLKNGTDKFRLSSQNGDIYVLVKLDRETQDDYYLQVQVIDSGSPPMSSSAFINITVTDINDEKPILETAKMIEEYEDLPVNSSIVKINATDKDTNAKLIYRINKQYIQTDGRGMFVNIAAKKDYFRIDEDSGEIFVNEKLDRETAEIISLGIEVEDMNAAEGKQITQGEQKIKILDVNDNKPEFLDDSIQLRKYENLPLNSTIATVRATDADKNDNVTYKFASNYSQFQIGETTGEIKLVASLDRETTPNISLIILAVDSNKPKRLTSTATVDLTILDYNDNAPTFPPGAYNKTYDIEENSPPNFEVVKVEAFDKDEGINAKIRYSLVYGNTDQDFPISINDTTGQVFVSGNLDRERKSFYRIEIEARDMDGQHTVDTRTGRTWIKINVTDLNDNSPTFDSPPYKTSIQEDKKIGQSVIQITASDKDGAENGRVEYALERSSLFRIDQSKGTIFVKSALTDQIGEENFIVVATDQGVPPLNSTANVTINIIDINNHEPVFNMTKSTIYIPEDTCRDSIISDISVIDEDAIAPNNEVECELKKDKDWTFFSLQNCKSLKLEKKLDSESINKGVYVIDLSAKDKGQPSLKSKTFRLTINATNVDDEPPQFLELEKNFEVEEGKPKKFVGNITAFDKDPASVACYKILDKPNDKENDSQYFEVKSVNGVGMLMTSEDLDYEKKKVFKFVLETDDCNHINYNKCGGIPVKDPQNKLDVIINVTDINDSPPRFKNRSMHLVIQADIKLHSVILNLATKITDDDEYPKNRQNYFEISNFVEHGEIFAQERPFLVSGSELKTNQLFSAAQKGYIQFSIITYDSSPGHNDTGTMKVFIVGKGNTVKIIFLQSFEETQKIMDLYSRDLEKTFGNNITIVPGKIESFQNEDGTFNKRKSVMYIYGIQREEIMSSEDLQSLFDQKSVKLGPVLNRYGVINVAKQKAQSKTSSSKLQVILFATIALLTVSTLAIILLFYRSTQRYKRKLKAAKIDVHGDKPDIDKWIVPGSNIHALGESNPIYNKEINPVVTLTDKVSLNSLDMNEVDDSAVFVDPYDEQEIALDFIDDLTNDSSHVPSNHNSKAFLDNVINEREAEMNRKNSVSMNGGVGSGKSGKGGMANGIGGYTNMALSVPNLETTDV